MITLRPASPADATLLRALAIEINNTPDDLATVIDEKCFVPGVAGPPNTTLAMDGAKPVGLSVTCGNSIRLLGTGKSDRLHGVGAALLRDAETRIARTGAKKVVIAAEAGNYFTPGVMAVDESTRAYLAHHDYEPERETDNLLASLDMARPEPQNTRRPPVEESKRVLDFIGRHFGTIWRFEASRAFEAALPTIFITEQHGEITGFAAHEANNRGLGTFGPTGVIEAMRGRGIGRELLLASLADLRRLGFSRAVIPWTEAFDFYRKACGAVPAFHFVTYVKHLRR